MVAVIISNFSFFTWVYSDFLTERVLITLSMITLITIAKDYTSVLFLLDLLQL